MSPNGGVHQIRRVNAEDLATQSIEADAAIQCIGALAGELSRRPDPAPALSELLSAVDRLEAVTKAVRYAARQIATHEYGSQAVELLETLGVQSTKLQVHSGGRTYIFKVSRKKTVDWDGAKLSEIATDDARVLDVIKTTMAIPEVAYKRLDSAVRAKVDAARTTKFSDVVISAPSEDGDG